MKHPPNVNELQKLAINYIGFIFYEDSARYVETVPEAFTGFDEVENQGIQKVGVFVDAPMEYVLNKVKDYQLDFVQLHGKETVAYCSELRSRGIRIIKAFSVDSDFVFANTAPYQNDCDYLLFDTKGKNPGGNGIRFDWSILKKYNGDRPFFLSGGIGPNDLIDINNLVLPKLHAVDLNSKFEIEPGLKNVELLSRFVSGILVDGER